jgi:hypothetical protein
VTVLLIVAIDGVSDFIPNLVTASIAFQVERICFFSCAPRCCCIVSSNEMARIHLHRFCFCDCPHEYSPPLPRQCNVSDRISKSSRRTCRATSSSAMLLLGYSEKSSSSRLPAQRLIHLAPKFRVRARSWSDSAAISVSAMRLVGRAQGSQCWFILRLQQAPRPTEFFMRGARGGVPQTFLSCVPTPPPARMN